MLDEPLDHQTIRRLSRQILRDGLVEWTTHALDEIEKDDLDELDYRSVIWASEDDGCDPDGARRSVAIPPPDSEDLGRHRV